MKATQVARNTSFVGNGQLGTIQTVAMTIGDTVHPTISVGSELGNLAGEDPRKRIAKQTITISPTAGTGSKLVVTLKRYCVSETGVALASGVTVDVDGTDYTTDTGGVISHALNGADYTTMYDLINAIQALPGFVCFIGDVLTTHTTNSNDFIALAETVLPVAANDLLDTLYRDVSEDDVAYVRVGLPRKFDMAPMQVIGLSGKITSATGGVGELITDNMAEYRADGAHQEVAFEFTPATSLTEHIDDNILNAGDYRGSLVLKVSATDASGASYKLKFKQVLGTHRNM